MNGSIVIATGRDWYGDPRLGTFTVYLDGRKAGKLPPRGRLVLSCRSGRHVVRIRQWWYLSPRLEADVGQATSLVIDADVTHRGSLARRWLTMMFAPWRGLSLVVVPAVQPTPQTSRQVRIWPFAGIAGGSVVLLLGLGSGSTPFVVIGGVTAVVFQVVGLQQAVAWYRSARRQD